MVIGAHVVSEATCHVEPPNWPSGEKRLSNWGLDRLPKEPSFWTSDSNSPFTAGERLFANTAPSPEDFFLQSAAPKPNKKNTYSAKKSCTPSKVRAGVSHSSRMEKSVRIYIYGQREKQPVSIIRQLCELTCSNVSENNSMPPLKKLQGVHDEPFMWSSTYGSGFWARKCPYPWIHSLRRKTQTSKTNQSRHPFTNERHARNLRCYNRKR